MPVKGRRVTRQVLVQGAAELLESGAYRDLTVDSLSRHLRMSKSTMYKYFIGKDDVVIYLINELCDEIDAKVASVPATGPARDQLSAVTVLMAEYATRLPAACIVQTAKMPKRARIRVERTREALTKAIRRAVSRGVQTKEFGYDHPEVAAGAFVASFFAVIADAAEEGTDRAKAVEDLLSLLEPGLKG